MGGFFGAAAEHNCISDVFFGTDYHSHLGTRRGGMTAYSPEKGFQRSIHSIENSPFRTKFESDVDAMEGNLCIGSISDTDPQPILLKSRLGTYAVCNIGIINNAEELCNELLSNSSASFEAMSSGKVNSSTLIGGLIAQRDNIVDGIKYAQEKIKRNFSDASTLIKLRSRFVNISSISSPSFLRINPWSTNMQVSCPGIAFESSAAQTEESTPPERPSTTFWSPTCSLTAAIWVLI